ncbi:MAG: autotransporter domain-containing protein, partial [Neisseriaceae bacterium]|nr:autotransporter domain-containing protein [Neisseriaceae bacterium]
RGGIYLADGNPFSFYNSYLSIYLTGKFNAPRSQNGTNYAVSGALVKWASNPLQLLGDPLALMRSKMSQQIEYYLSDNGEVANPNDVFVLWGGGNDMTGDMMQAAMPWNWSKVLTSDGGYLDEKPTVLGGYAQLLADKGAENIFMLGLPDPGLAPFSGAAIVGSTLGSMGMFMDGTPLEKLNPGNWVLGAMDAYLRNNDNLVGSPVGNADEYMIDNYARMYNHFVPFIPTELWRWAIVIPSQLQRNLVIRWNRDLQNRLMDVDGNVVYADIYRLYEEVQNDPYAYGFTNILVAQCTLGKESTICDAGDDYYHGDDGQVYMYTDWHHPSPQMNQIIAEYLLSVFNAPGYVAGLSRVAEMNENVRSNFMKSEMKYMRFDERQVGEFTTFASILAGLDKNSRSLNPRNLSTQGIGAGFAYRAAEGLDIGASLALTYGDKHPSNQLKYKDSSQALTAFIQYKDPNGFWANGQVYTGWEQMDDIKRSMQFLKHVRTEKGDTKGTMSGFGASMGYDFLLSELGCGECSTTWYATPYIEGSVTKFKVKGYQEEGNSSTAMEFNEQKRTNKLGTLGVQFSSRSPKLNTNLDLAYTRNFDYEEFEAEGRLKNFAKDFHRSGKGISKERKGWVSITPSVEYKINDQVSAYGNVNYNYGNSKFTQLNGAIGIRSKF